MGERLTYERPKLIPLEGADIIVLGVFENLTDEESLVPAGRAVTGEDGFYLVDNLPHGLYVVIAKKEGYTWSNKKARVRHINETRVDFILLPLGMPEPPSDLSIVYQGDFESGDEGWKHSGAPDFFDLPDAFHENGRIRLRAKNNRQNRANA